MLKSYIPYSMVCIKPCGLLEFADGTAMYSASIFMTLAFFTFIKKSLHIFSQIVRYSLPKDIFIVLMPLPEMLKLRKRFKKFKQRSLMLISIHGMREKSYISFTDFIVFMI